MLLEFAEVPDAVPLGLDISSLDMVSPAGVGVQWPSEVPHPCSKDAAGASRGRWAAETRRWPLDDELGGDWQQIPTQTERRIRNGGWMPDSKAGLDAQRSPKEIRHFSSLYASNPPPADALDSRPLR